ncbi:MAG: DUF6716 putative glycosyltransferase [Parasynechococcus sp.]|uniref:DUF6716 putative glycosyltransferase n=1 Tax=Parasynechococcus sp. TaxID=3101203 RepID=UPI0038863187
MSIVLVGDGALEQYSCHHFANAWRQAGRSCLVVGPSMAGDQPLPHRSCDLTLNPKELLGSTVLDNASAIGLFLRNPADVEAITAGYRALRRSRGLWTAPIFSGPLMPLAGDELIDAFLLRLSCDLMIVSGDDQLRQLEAMTSLWPAELKKPRLIATGFCFPAIPPTPPSPKPMLVALLQHDIPTHLGAKEQLIRLLQRWGREQTDWTVVLQPDHPWSSARSFADDQINNPPNVVEAAPEQMLGLLSRCTACLSVSSPWSLAAMMWGRIPIVVGDYGIQAEQHTTNFFGCGAMHRLRDLGGLHKLQELPLVNQGWLEAMGGGIEDGPLRLLISLDSLSSGTTAP